MTRRFAFACAVAILLAAIAACTKKVPAQQLVVEIPTGFSGNFVLNMGMRDAPPLSRQGEAYVLSVPAFPLPATLRLQLFFRTRM